MNIQDETLLRRQIVSLIPRLRRFALGLARNAQDADDMVQLALERSLTRLHQFEPGSRLDSWMFRIVQTTWLDEQRRASRRRLSDDPSALEEARAPSGYESNVLDLRKDLSAAMAKLNDDQKAIVMLVLVEGQSYEEAGETLGVPVGTVMSRLARARQTLMKSLQGIEVRP
jgi:RNA polymerase sigma-70 factor, ECF subfamily